MILRESIKSKIGFRLFLMIALAAAAIWAWSQSSFAQQGGVARYFYDANGRLTTVLSPTGEAAIYQYDPAGNFTSITRRPANVLSIIDFTPEAGNVGAQVSIYGTGFSDTPSANTVTFNGVTATVTAASKIQLTVNVPVGATTGPINVTNANGAVNSSGNFFVSGIVEFSRRINFGESLPFLFDLPPPGQHLTNVGMLTFDGIAGQRVSVVVDTTPCIPIFAGPQAQISLISPSGSILTTVPYDGDLAYIDAMTLPVTGTYTILIDPSDQFPTQSCIGDPFSQPQSFRATARLYDVPPDVTGMISTAGLPTPVSFAAPGQKVALTFNGFNGQRISLRVLQDVSTLIGTDIKLYGPGTYPNGTPIISQTMAQTQSLFVDATTLTATGTYTILVDPQLNKTRPVTLMLYDVPPEATGILTINGPVVTSTLVPGQAALLTFNVTSTQSVRVEIVNEVAGDDGPFYNNEFRLLRSDNSLVRGIQTFFTFTHMGPDTLTPGTYKVKIDPLGANAGRVGIYLVSE